MLGCISKLSLMNKKVSWVRAQLGLLYRRDKCVSINYTEHCRDLSPELPRCKVAKSLACILFMISEISLSIKGSCHMHLDLSSFLPHLANN